MKTKLLLLAPLAASICGCVTINIGTDEPIKAEVDMNLRGDVNVTADDSPAPKDDKKKETKKNGKQ